MSKAAEQSFKLLVCTGALLLILLLAACQAPSPPPVVERSTGYGTTASGRPVADSRATHYVVQPGDTLYSIAWRFGQNYQELARRNGISAPYRIYPDQQLVLRGAAVSTPSEPATATAARPSRAPERAASGPAPSDAGGYDWRWPAQGTILRDYGGMNRGIDMSLPPGSPVVTVAPGEVVYAGSGLRGYRHLVIVKHDVRYLSAYSFNDQVQVGEGEKIKAGARLADISSGGPTANLRFEIRREGQPVNPRDLLD